MVDPLVLRILRYDYAVALFQFHRFEEATAIAKSLAEEYERIFGISYARNIHGSSPSEIAAAIGNKREEIEELKRFGDVLDLYARILQARQQPTVNLFLNAHKLYLLANAPTSAVKSGLEYVYDVIELGAVHPARLVMEQALIPLVQHHGMLGHVVPVQSQYAVVLAYDGDVAAAQRLLANLADVVGPEQKAEFAYRRSIVERIANGELRLGPLRAIIGNERPLLAPTTKVGRNQLCPCGSGIKYKRCCGK